MRSPSRSARAPVVIDLLALVEAAEHLDDVVVLGADLHGAEDGRRRSCGVKHAAPAAQIDDGVGRHDQRVLLGVGA